MISSGFIVIESGEMVAYDWDVVNSSLIAAWENGKKGGRPKNKTQKKPTGNPDVTDKRREEKRGEDKIEPQAVVSLLSKHPEFQQIKDCEPLRKMTIERYIEIKHAFPKVKASQALFLACLKATAPETEIRSLDGFLRSQFQYAPEADKRDIPYALGGLQIRLNYDGSPNEDDRKAFKKAVC